ncbi:MAG: TSCPD domain-containing protein, partial [Thermodesulfobacteriota bacterium]
PLLPYESCNLGSINLSRMVTNNSHGMVSSRMVDYERLRRVVRKSVHFLDNVIDMNRYPLHSIKEMTHGNRKIGLGVMGWADMLIRLGISYNSEDATRLAGEVMGFIQEESRKTSVELAKQRGVFPNYKGSVWDKKGIKVRNATTTTIAPTGTISIIAGCSSGIEPLFAISFVRNVMDGARLVDTNPLFEETAKQRGFYNRSLLDEVAEKGALEDIKGIPEDVKRIFVTAHDITPEWHIRTQTVFQKYTDNAVSKTVNFPHDATREDVSEVYKLAYFLGCKGVTVYRDGSRDAQVLNIGSDVKKQELEAKAQGLEIGTSAKEGNLYVQEGGVDKQVKGQDIHYTPTPRPRGEITFGATRKIKTGCGNLYVTINEDKDGRPFEIFTQMGKAGGCAASQSEAIGRLVSLAFRSGINPDLITKQLKGISCHLPTWQSGGKVLSCSDGIAKAIEWYLTCRGHADRDTNAGSNHKPSDFWPKSSHTSNRGACPDCGGTVEHVEGCVVCRGCGYTECE